VTLPESAARLADGIRTRVDSAGSLGLDVALLDDRERAVVDAMDDIVLAEGRLRYAGAVDRLAEHPFLVELLAGGFTPAPLVDIDRDELRQLIRRGDVVQRDGILFHRETIEHAAALADRLLAEHPAGFTMSQFRDATEATRKYCIPLIEELDARGITRRRGDVRIAGPRLIRRR
jgi:selenocysteine-specific elongation factor